MVELRVSQGTRRVRDKPLRDDSVARLFLKGCVPRRLLEDVATNS